MQPSECHLVRRDSSAIKSDRVETAFISALIYWLKPLTDEGDTAFSTGVRCFLSLTTGFFAVRTSLLVIGRSFLVFTTTTYFFDRQERFCWLVACLTSQQHASVSQGRICSDNFTCCHTEIEAADQTFHLTQSQYTDTGPTSPSTDPITPSAWQGSHRSVNFSVTGMTRPGKIPGQAEFEPRIFRSRGGRLNH